MTKKKRQEYIKRMQENEERLIRQYNALDDADEETANSLLENIALLQMAIMAAKHAQPETGDESGIRSRKDGWG